MVCSLECADYVICDSLPTCPAELQTGLRHGERYIVNYLKNLRFNLLLFFFCIGSVSENVWGIKQCKFTKLGCFYENMNLDIDLVICLLSDPPCPLRILLTTCDNFKCLSIYLHVVSMKIPSDLNCWSNLGLTMRGHTDIRLHASWLFYCSPVCCNTSRWQIYPAFYGIIWKSGAIFVWKKLWFNLTSTDFLDSLSYPLF